MKTRLNHSAGRRCLGFGPPAAALALLLAALPATAQTDTPYTALVWGTAYQEVGTFDAANNLTATGGLYQRSVVDTPQADPALTSAELSALSGMNLNVFADSGAPRISGNLIMLSAFQYTDGTQPQLDVTYDNLELRTSEIPPLGIGQVVALTWPDVGSYSVEGAPTVQGPWLPVNDTVSPGMKQTTVPSSQPAQFFRLR